MDKSIIIVGAGIAGLAAGCYGQMNSYRTRIFEMHTTPGGLCTAWKRNGYTIDGCIHWLVGSSPKNDFYRFWEELGAVQGRRIIDHDEYMRIEGEDGKVFIVYTDSNRLEQHMKQLAPEDNDVIEEFVEGIRRFTCFDMPVDKAPELYNIADWFKMLLKMFPHLGIMRKWQNISVHDYARRFKNPFLRQAFPLTLDVPDIPMMALLITLAWLDQKTSGYPLGGSLEFARGIEKRYLDLKGEINYRSPVSRILVENDKAVGVQLADGSEHRSDIVISAADGHATIFNMLGGNYINNKIKGYFDELPIFPPLIYIGLGVARTFDDIPHLVAGMNYSLNEPITIDRKELKRLGVLVHNYDPDMAPSGKTVVRVILESDYERWKELQQDPERYKAEKEQIANQVIALLDQRFPGLAAQVEMCDVATPTTWEHYTGNWQGSFEGWLFTTKTLGMRMSKTLPGLKNFYMAGQWVEPGGGLPTVAMSGRNVIQIICKQDRKQFTTRTS